MKNFSIRLTENKKDGKILDCIVDDKTLSYLERARHFKGYTSFSIDVYEDNVRQRAQNMKALNFEHMVNWRK